MALLSTFLRSFTIQGSWNYHTMVGGGLAFCLLPVLRAVARSRDEPLQASIQRHVGHFNAHPYLTSLALGAISRLEADGESHEEIRRFKVAIRGPLGGLGDTLVWAGWLPATALIALIAAWWGAGPVATVLLFLILYNMGHLTLRTWAFTAGLDAGKDVGPLLRSAHLGPLADRVARLGSLLVGFLGGLMLTKEEAFRSPAWLWIGLAVAAFATGMIGGQRVWRPTALVVVGTVGVVIVLGSLP
jgi:mannose/fructose/N-acetylgalactosamine-specific phosphotransferase system component IID